MSRIPIISSFNGPIIGTRIKLFEAVSQYKEISLDLLLFGGISLSFETNGKLFEKVQNIYNHYQKIHCYAVILRMYETIFVKFAVQNKQFNTQY